MGLLFNGTSQYIDCGIIQKTIDFSISAWVRPHTWGNSSVLLSCNSYFTSAQGCGILCRSNQQISLLTSNGTLGSGYSVALEWNSTNFPSTKWTHICMTVSGVTVKYYRNGILISTLTAVTLNSGTTYKWSIGRPGEYTGGYYFDGEMMDVRYYNTTLNTGSVSTIYASRGSDKIVDGLVGRWLMMEKPEGTSATGDIYDSSGTRLYRKPSLHHLMNDGGSSIIGPNPVSVGTPTFDGAKWNNGLNVTPSTINDTLRFEAIPISANGSFSMSFTWKAKQSRATINGSQKGISWTNTGDIEIAWERGYFACQLETWNGRSGGIMTTDFDDSAFNFGIDDEIAISISCDMSQSAGNKWRAWMNGTELAKVQNPYGTASETWHETDLYIQFNTNFGGSYSADGILDNLKVYPYAKTDFTADLNEQFGYWEPKTQNNGSPVNSPVYKASPIKLLNPKRGN